jgi:hypothetical protein
MSTDTPSPPEPLDPLAGSGVTVHSDSEQYSASASPPTSSDNNSPPLVLYQPPTMWSLFRGALINMVLPFVNGMMLGFGELFAHEAAFRLGWSGTRVGFTLSCLARRVWLGTVLESRWRALAVSAFVSASGKGES